MLLFRSEEHAGRWIGDHGGTPGAFLTLEQQWRLSRAWFQGRLDPGFRRRTEDEAAAVFEEIGLTGPFWSLSS